MEPKPYFDGIKVGDKIWTIGEGECTVVRIDNDEYPIHVENSTGDSNDYRMDGKLLSYNAAQSAFWSNPNIIAPPKPKRIVKKTGRGFASCVSRSHENGTCSIHMTVEFNELLPTVESGSGKIVTIEVEE